MLCLNRKILVFQQADRLIDGDLSDVVHGKVSKGIFFFLKFLPTSDAVFSEDTMKIIVFYDYLPVSTNQKYVKMTKNLKKKRAMS